MTGLSILIPTYNGVCTALVSDLQRQAEALGVDYEIIVADDGSSDHAAIEANRGINGMTRCHYVECRPNRGRAAIRNYLACQAAYPWLLFVDSDMTVRRDDFLSRYAKCAGEDVVYGGVSIGGDGSMLGGNLRYRYEKRAEAEHSAERRQQAPYHDFHTANFMIRRELMLAHPFDERFRHYGYEDVLLGKQMKLLGIGIRHIDNPLSFETFEDNATFVSKTEEGLRTLHEFRDELRGYSRMLDFQDRHRGLIPWLRVFHRLFGKMERRWLTGNHPSLTLFNIYKMGYFSLI